MAAQAGDDVDDVVDSEHDAAYAQRVRRRAFRLGSDRRRRVELRQLKPAVAVRGPHHGDVGTNVVEPDDAVHPTPLERRLALQLHTEFGEERFGGLEVVDNDENVVHPLNRHSGGGHLQAGEVLQPPLSPEPLTHPPERARRRPAYNLPARAVPARGPAAQNPVAMRGSGWAVQAPNLPCKSAGGLSHLPQVGPRNEQGTPPCQMLRTRRT